MVLNKLKFYIPISKIIYRNFIFIHLVFLALLNQSCQKILAAHGQWELHTNEDNIQLYNRQRDDGNKEFLVITNVSGYTLNSFMAVLNDTDNYHSWMEGLSYAKVIRNINDMERLTYMVFKAPWPVSDRDSVTYTKVSQDAKTSTIYIYLDTMPNAYPIQDGKVRMTLSRGYYKFTPNAQKKTIEILYQANVDPGGSLPEWAKNLSKTKLPFATMKKLLQNAKLPKYVNTKVKGVKEAW